MARQMLPRFDGSIPLDPGALRHQLEIQRRVVDSSGYDITSSWQTIHRGRFQVYAMSGKELESMQQRFADARYRIKGWAPSAPFEREDRIVWGPKYLDILDVVDPDGLGRTVSIVAREWTE